MVDIKGKSTSATWYEIWEAVTALNAVCVRDKNQGGKAYGMGECSHVTSVWSRARGLSRGCRPPEKYLRRAF